jgi:TPR repeat protein
VIFAFNENHSGWVQLLIFKGENMKKSAFFVFIASAILILGCGQTDTRSERVIKKQKKLQKDAEVLRKRAEKGDSDAMIELAHIYQNGWGVTQDKKIAVTWLRKSAGLDNFDAIRDLARCYEKGQGVAKSKEESERLFKKFFAQKKKDSDAGDTRAMTTLAHAYDHGDGVIKDKSEATRWWEKAAERGDPIALQKLICRSVPLDKDLNRTVANADTVKWLSKSIELGNTTFGYVNEERGDFAENGIVLVALGDCYRDGNGVEKNMEEAIRLYKKAIEKGSERGKLRLSKMSGSIK